MKWFIGFILLISAVYFLTIYSTSHDFVCAGKRTSNGMQTSNNAKDISVRLVQWPIIQRTFGTRQGMVFFKSRTELFYITNENDINITFQGENEKSLGIFDRISKRLLLNTGYEEFDLICKTAQAI